MSKSPLREYLDRTEQSAEGFAAAHGLSPWNVRHWARGDKEPTLKSQLEIERATEGEVAPAAWLEWSIIRSVGEEEAANRPFLPSESAEGAPGNNTTQEAA